MKWDVINKNMSVIVIGIVTGIIAILIVSIFSWLIPRLAGTTIPWETTAVIVAVLLASSFLFAYQKRQTEKLSSRLDLLFRMDYQGPFVQSMDAEEKKKYAESINRKLASLGLYHCKFGEIKFCSYYIGCLAFLASEKRGNVPWEGFRNSLAEHFGTELLDHNIEAHIITEHFSEEKYNNLLEEARKRKNPDC